VFEYALPPQDIRCLPEETYTREMDETVQPALAALRRTGYVERVAGQPVYWEYYPLQNAKATLVISHGFTESADKFRELAYYCLQAGIQVYAVDHRGHGHSYRHVPQTWLTHVEKFDDYVQDLHAFLQQVVLAQGTARPLVLYGHSMGGAIAARIAQQYPDIFDRVVLNAPMIRANPGKMPPVLAHMLASFMLLIGRSKKPIPIHKPFDGAAPFERACSTSRARYDYYLARQKADACLQNTAATYRWMREAMDITAVLLDEENCARVKAPVMLFQAEQDTLVCAAEQQMFAERIAQGSLVRIEGTKHEIYRSTNAVLQPYLQKLLAFVVNG